MHYEDLPPNRATFLLQTSGCNATANGCAAGPQVLESLCILSRELMFQFRVKPTERNLNVVLNDDPPRIEGSFRFNLLQTHSVRMRESATGLPSFPPILRLS
jgi:hypothetical protein